MSAGKRVPTHVRVTTRDGELCPYQGTPDMVGYDGSWEVPRAQWEQYRRESRRADNPGAATLDLAPKHGAR